MKGKGNSGEGNIPERDEWETSKELFDLLNKQYTFEFDCCANAKNKKCIGFSNDFLSEKEDYILDAVCWMNPPFSKAKEMFEKYIPASTWFAERADAYFMLALCYWYDGKANGEKARGPVYRVFQTPSPG